MKEDRRHNNLRISACVDEENEAVKRYKDVVEPFTYPLAGFEKAVKSLELDIAIVAEAGFHVLVFL